MRVVRHYLYRDAILAKHGVVPNATTPPEAARSVVNGLYRYELRRLRERLLRREFLKKEYIEKVIEIRKRYVIMSIPVRSWTWEIGVE